MRSINSLKLKNKIILLRVDYNVPIIDGQIVDAFRIKITKETIDELLSQSPKKLIIISHLGRPQGFEIDKSLRPVAGRLAQVISAPVEFVDDWRQFDFKKSQSQILLLENLRFDPGEKANDLLFAKDLINQTGAEIFIQDGFAVCHRQTATTDAITDLLPSYASTRLQKEYQTVSQFLDLSAMPKMAIVGGAKIDDKIDFLAKLAEQVDILAIGGAMANVFLAENGQIAKNYATEEQLESARLIKKIWRKQHHNFDNLILPVDAKTTTNLKSDNVVNKTINEVDKEVIGDIGQQSIQNIINIAKQAQTILWNGNLGYTENPALATSTNSLVDYLKQAQTRTLIGGGDTVAFFLQNENKNANGNLTLSSGGGAMLDLIAYQSLVGVEALDIKI